MKKITQAAVTAGLALGLAPAWAQPESARAVSAAATATRWQFSTGLDYSAGKYGAATDTTVLSIPFGAVMQADRLRLELTVPYLEVEGPGSSAGGVVVPGAGGVSTRSGLGDVTLGAAWLLHPDDGNFPAIELAGSLKAPTAEVGLGTGKWDYNILANIYHTISPDLMVFGSVGYSWLNDFQTFDLKDGVTFSAGANFKPSAQTAIGASVNFRQEYFAGLGDQFTLTPYLLWDFRENLRLSAYGLVGMTRSSPRIGGGFRIILMR